jgi:heme-degrading monooxygenase HmoA
MLLQQLQMDTRPGQETAFEAGLLEVRQQVFRSAGFRGFAVSQNAERPTNYLVQVRWETVEELTEFVQSGRAARAWAPVEAYLVRDPLVEHFLERPALGLTGPGVIADLV